MFKVESQVTEERISRIAKNLRYVSTNTFLAGLSLKQQASVSLAYLESVFPQGESKHSVKEFGQHLKDGWLTSAYVRGNVIGFRLSHELEGRRRVDTVLNALDTGSKAFSYIASKTVRFLGSREHSSSPRKGKSSMVWFTIKQGTLVRRKARPGFGYIQATKDFIEEFVLPDIQNDVADKIINRIIRTT